MNKHNIMAHMVAFYPDREKSITIAKALDAGGAEYLEIQFPFSDPSADGVLIQGACSKALENDFNTKEGFKLVKEISSFAKSKVYIMTYGNLAYTYGLDNFIKDSINAGVEGLIIPDLTPGFDEGLYEKGREYGIKIVPVISPNISEDRLKQIMNENPEIVYAVLRVGITGKKTDSKDVDYSFLKRLRNFSSDLKIIGGFGLQNNKQINAIAPFIDIPVVGSEFLRVMNASGFTDNLYDLIKTKCENLIVKDGHGKKET